MFFHAGLRLAKPIRVCYIKARKGDTDEKGTDPVAQQKPETGKMPESMQNRRTAAVRHRLSATTVTGSEKWFAGRFR